MKPVLVYFNYLYTPCALRVNLAGKRCAHLYRSEGFQSCFGATRWFVLCTCPRVSYHARDFLKQFLTCSLPQDVCVYVAKNDHAGGQGRIYTSNLNFVSTHLSQPSHRRGCCCMPPKCHPRQCVACCLLSCALFVVKIVLSLLRAVFVQMAGNSVVDVPRCDTSWL